MLSVIKQTLKRVTAAGVALMIAVSLIVGTLPARPVEAAGPNGMAGQGMLGVPYLVETCDDFQAINEDLTAYYRLQNDINCSDTVNWHGGEGFRPIGWDDNNVLREFTGHLDGRSHTVSGMYMDYSSVVRSRVGIFEQLGSGAKILNTYFDTTTIVGPEPNSGGNSFVGGLAGGASGASTIDTVRMNTLDIDIPCSTTDNHRVLVGGMVGSFNGVVTRSYVASGGSISAINCPSQMVSIGGIAGKSNGGTIRDSWSGVGIVADSQSINADEPRQIGGIVGSAYDSAVTNSYTNGSITMNYTAGDWQNWDIGGLIGYSNHTQITSSFTMGSVSATCSGVECGASTQNVGTMIGSNATGEGVAGSYYDETRFGMSASCDGGGGASCTAVNTSGLPDPNYFFNQPTNPPMDMWDFTVGWDTGCTGCTPGVPGPSALYPDAPYQLSTQVISTTSINVVAQYGDYTPPGNSYRAHDLLYKKSSDTEWQSTGQSFDGFGDIPSSIDGLEPGTQYDFMFVVQIDKGYYAVSDTVSGRTAREGFTLITNCQQLQDIDLALRDNYELGNDIDCSDTINWNSGAGFDPIGYISPDFQTIESFSGVFAGNNYAISDVYIDSTGVSIASALFAITYRARIQDVRIIGMTQLCYSICGGGSLVANAGESSITNIQISGGVAEGSFMSYGGIAGAIIINNPGTYTLTKSSYDGIMTLVDTVDLPGITESYGGLVGQINNSSSDVNLNIKDNYSVNSLDDVSGTVARGGAIGFIFNGGSTNAYVTMENVYADGVMQLSDTYTPMNVAAGIVAVSVGQGMTIRNSFSYLDLADSGSVFTGKGGIVGASVDSFGSPLAADLTSSYFDADQASITNCDSYSLSSCNVVLGEPNYFFNNTTNPPLNSWDFTNIWQTTSTLPVFGQSVTQTVSEIPAQYLTTGGGSGSGGGPAATNGEPIKQDATTVTKVVERAFGNPTSSSTDNRNAFEKIADKVRELLRSLPEPVVRAFPFVLFIGTIAGTGIMALETRRQARRLQILRSLITKQRSLAQQRDTFWHLAANYLRAPVTLLMGGVELLMLNTPKTTAAKSLGAAVAKDANISSTNAAAVEKIAKLVKNMQMKVAAIMDEIESSQTLRGIEWPADAPVRVMRSLGFWITAVFLAGFLGLANYVAVGFRHLSVGTTTYLTQVVLFGLVAYALYWAFGGLRGMKRKVKTAEALMAEQAKALTAARSKLMGKTVQTLENDVVKLQDALDDLTVNNFAAINTLREGSNRLRSIINSFQLLNAAETNQLSSLSPIGAVSKVDSILKDLTDSEQAMLDAKRATLDKPVATNLTIPGDDKLSHQVIGTVLDNAIAFSPEGGTIELELLSKPGFEGIAIHDHGKGVDKDQLTHMFEPFTKADGDDALRMNHEGLGIDLYLNKLIMDFLGGDISVKSALGKGTTVSMWWPRAKV